MYIKIYQMAPESKTKFLSLDKQPGQTANAEQYLRVFSGDVDCADLEDVFRMFNNEGHRLHRGHSLSVSDVVEVVADNKSTFHYCDSMGFRPIEFYSDQAQAGADLIRVLVVEPGRKPYESEIVNTLRGQQLAVEGYIEYVDNGDGTYIVCNEEGKLQHMQPNRRYYDDILVGPFFVAGVGEDDLCSLTDEQVAAYMERFAEPEQIAQSDVGSIFYCIQ